MDPHTFNVVQLGIGFFFIFSAFNSQGFIEETVIDSYAERGIVDKHDGYTSLAIIYAVFTLANFLAAPIVGFLNARWAMVFGGITYAIFQFGFLFLSKAYLYGSSALIGLGAAVIWTAQGKYLSLNSNEETAGKHSGLFWAISQACISLGGIFLFFVFRTSDKIDDATVHFLYGVFTIVTIIGVVVLAILRLPSAVVPVESGDGIIVVEQQLSHTQTIVSTIKLARSKRMIVMAIVFAYSGVELSFWSGIYPTCISSTQRLGSNTKTLLALNAITQGLGQATSGFLFGILSSKTRRFGRDRIIILGAIVHMLAFAAIYINFPSHSPLGPTSEGGIIEPSVVIALLCGFLLGFGDACWNTQIFAFLISKFPSRSAQAFSLFKFFQSLLTCAAFFYSKAIVLQWHLIILLVGAILAGISFVIAERMPDDVNEDGEVHND